VESISRHLRVTLQLQGSTIIKGLNSNHDGNEEFSALRFLFRPPRVVIL